MAQIKNSSVRPVIVGLGYVGLPLLIKSAGAGLPVIGLDKDQKKIDKLSAKKSYIKHIPTEALEEALEGVDAVFTSDPSIIREATHIIICLPTPLGAHREPDLSYVLDTARELAPHLIKGHTYVLESTTYPGTTEDEMRAVLEAGSGLKAGVDFHLAYSPEREDPGNPQSDVALIPKLVGGFTLPCREKAIEFYSQFVKNIVPVSSCAVAESAKLLENIFRSVNIALVNELKIILDEVGIDVWEVINAAKTKPFGYMAFYPGPGLGGHCIPIDPFYLSWKAREVGHTTRFIELAGEINTAMPRYVVDRLAEALNEQGKPIKNSKIMVLGLAYKANVDDDRESASYHLLDLLKKKGADISFHDPYVPVIPKSREHAHWAGFESSPWSEEFLSSLDAVVVATAHSDVDYALALDRVPLILDTRNVYHSKNLSSTEKTTICKA